MGIDNVLGIRLLGMDMAVGLFLVPTLVDHTVKGDFCFPDWFYILKSSETFVFHVASSVPWVH